MKNVCYSLLLVFTFFTTIAHAQYADDNVTIHDNRKAKDPFKAGKKSKNTDSSNIDVSKIISLTDIDPEKGIPAGIAISDIRVINAVSDSSLLGYVQIGAFNRWVEALPDKPYTAYLQSL